MSLQLDHIYEFEDFRLDSSEKTLRRSGEIVSITPKVFETLHLFVENAGHLIEKDELMEKLWQERFVEESNLTFNIKMLRKALGDDAQKPRFLETVPKRGYRFIADVRRIEAAARGRTGENGKNDLSIVSSSPLLPTTSSFPAASHQGAVVALADWRHGLDTVQPEASTGPSVELALAPARPIIRTQLKYLAFVAVGFVLVSIGLGYYFLNTPGGGEAIDSVAVLPFVNATGDADTEYLSEGISDSIINSLTRLPNLKVNSLNSVMRYKGKEVDPRVVGRELNVRAVLMGTLTKQGDGLAISVELIDVRDDSRLWGGQYSGKVSNILSVQGEIARDVSEGLRLRLSGEDKELLAKQQTENNDAYLFYSLGTYFNRRMTKEGFEKGIESFDQAIKIDPNYALAYAGLAGTYQFMMSRGFSAPEEYEQKVEWAALKALQLDDTLAEAHASLGAHKLINFDWAGAEKEIKRALELDPDSSLANSRYVSYLHAIGRADEAIPYALRDQELNPTKSGQPAFAYFLARQYGMAIEMYRKNLEIKPDNAHAQILLGEAYVAIGRPAEGVAEIEKGMALDTTLDKTPERWDRYPLLAYAYAAAGRRDEARKILDGQQRLANGRYVSPYNFAIIYTGLGDKDQAFEWLTKCVEQRIMIIYHLKARPLFDPLRSDPRYAELLRKMNLTP